MSLSHQTSRCQQAFSKPCLVNLISKDSHQYSLSLLSIYDGKCSYVYISASFAMSTSILKALPGKLDIKRHSPSILYLFLQFTMESVHMSISRQASRCQQAFSKPCLVNLISKDTHLVFSISSFNLRWKVFICLYLDKLRDVNKRSQSLAW